MNRFLGACLALAFCMPAVGQQSLNADVVQLGPGAYRIKVTFPGVVAPDQAQLALAEVGTHLCQGQTPTWGRYEFETLEPATPSQDAQANTNFQQDFACGVVVARPGTPAPKTPATDADRHDVETLTLDYLTRKDRNDFATADAMFEEDVIAQFDRTWRDARRAFNADAGIPASRSIVGVTFYDDPADAPRLGRYAAVDFRAAYESRAFYCGYVLWLQGADGNWRLTREDESLATGDTVRGLPEDQLQKLKPQPGCWE